MAQKNCLFCRVQDPEYKDEIVYQSEHFFVTRDSYPVTKYHTLIILKRCAPSFFHLTDEEVKDFLHTLKEQERVIKELDHTVSAFNIGINDGPDAGRSVNHLHIHLIPRRPGDIDNPQGGVRGVIPSKQKYTKKEVKK